MKKNSVNVWAIIGICVTFAAAVAAFLYFFKRRADALCPVCDCDCDCDDDCCCEDEDCDCCCGCEDDADPEYYEVDHCCCGCHDDETSEEATEEESADEE